MKRRSRVGLYRGRGFLNGGIARPGMSGLAGFLSFAWAVLLSGCSSFPTVPGLTPYKIEIQQGNYVTQEMVSKLKPGMTREQVRFVLGTPLVSDIFHPDRWDYIYARRPAGGGKFEERRFAVFFEDDKLKRVEGDVVPQAAPPEGAGPKAEN